MSDHDAPYHAHLYYVAETRDTAEAVRRRLLDSMAAGDIPRLLFVGQLKDGKAGPHPIPQFEIHFTKQAFAGDPADDRGIRLDRAGPPAHRR